MTKDIANIFFPWKEPKFILGDAAFWVVALITAIFAAPALILHIGVEATIAAVALGAFVGAGVQQVSNALEPRYPMHPGEKWKSLITTAQYPRK